MMVSDQKHNRKKLRFGVVLVNFGGYRVLAVASVADFWFSETRIGRFLRNTPRNRGEHQLTWRKQKENVIRLQRNS
jgi:hypothetical protein